MQSFKIFVILYILGIFFVSIALLFFGVNYLENTITSLGFFPENKLIHDTFAVITFVGGFIVVFLNSVLYIKKEKKVPILGVLIIISNSLLLTGFAIFEWITFWLLCIFVLKEIVCKHQ